VKQAALDARIPVFQPRTLRERDAVSELNALEADLMVVVAYGLLLPQDVLVTPRLGCVNVHASVLPRWRGAAPIQRAILAGDGESGVTIMRMEAGLDTGPMYLIRRLTLAPRETAGSLHDKLSALGAEALCEALPGIADGSLVPEPQDDSLANYAKKLSKDDPWPVALTALGDGTLRLWTGEAVRDGAQGQPPGTVIAASKAGIDVATGDGVFRVTRLQPPGKRPMSAAEFLNSRNLDGEVLG
jgi:methionyl-tRNA formyltransferase